MARPDPYDTRASFLAASPPAAPRPGIQARPAAAPKPPAYAGPSKFSPAGQDGVGDGLFSGIRSLASAAAGAISNPYAGTAGPVGDRRPAATTAVKPAVSAAPVANVPHVVAPQIPAPKSAQVAPVGGVGLKGAIAGNAVGLQQPSPFPATSAQLPYHAAESQMLNRQADAAAAAHSPINDFPMIDRHNAERLDLFKQYHGGMSPGEYQQTQRNAAFASPGQIGLQADPARQRLAQQAAQPGVSYQAGVPVYSGNAGDGGEGYSVADRNAGRGASASQQLAAYDKNQSEIQGADKVGMIDKLNATPERRATALALGGVDGPTIASLPSPTAPGQPRFNTGNVESAATDPAVAGLWNILNGPSPLHHKVAAAASIPGIESPGSTHRQVFAAWLARQQANREQWGQDISHYGNTGPSAENGLSGYGFLGRMVGGEPNIAARNRQFHGDMGRLGYQFHPGQY